MVELLEAVILSIIQGITEWLPVSSSGHLALFESWFSLKEFSFAVFLHFSSILAVIVIFWKDIIRLVDFRKFSNLKYIGLIILGIIPAGIFGFLLSDKIKGFFSNISYIGIFFMISGIIILSTKFFSEKKEKVGLVDSVVIGLFQVLGLFPGISRSGATISGGIFRGVNRDSVIKFSFLMAIPVIIGASLLELNNIIYSEISWSILFVSFIVSFLTSLFAIKILLRVIKKDKFYLFGIYNFILGVIVIVWGLT